MLLDMFDTVSSLIWVGELDAEVDLGREDSAKFAG